MSVLDVMKRILDENRVPHRLRIQGTYEKQEHITQYGESNWAFLRRIAAERGLFFFLDHPSDSGDLRTTGRGSSEVLVLCDSAQAYSPLESLPVLEVQDIGHDQALQVPEHNVFDVLARRGTAATSALVRAYDHARPNVDLRSSAEVASAERGSEKPTIRYEFGGVGDASPPEYQLAAARLDAARRDTLVIEGSSAARLLQIGRTTRLDGHDVGAFDREVVISEIHHMAYAPEACPPNAPLYANRVKFVPKEVALRPDAPLSRPYAGAETAIVVGAPGKEIDPDEQGRIRVRFHWQLGASEAESTCWVRVAHVAADAGTGHQHIHRVGTEVVITYLGGNPDRPLCVGAVYNATHPFPFKLPTNAAVSGMRSASTPGGGGQHELWWDDTKGSERMHMRAERDLDVEVKNNHTSSVGGNSATEIGGNQVIHVAGRLRIQVDGGGVKTPLTVASSVQR